MGYIDDWANNLSPFVTGYYTTWNLALKNAKDLERKNLDFCKGLQKVYIVEIKVNKTYPTTRLNWIENYPYHYIITDRGKTILQSSNSETKQIKLPPTTVEQQFRSQRSHKTRSAEYQ